MSSNGAPLSPLFLASLFFYLFDAGEWQLVVFKLDRVRADSLHLPHLLGPESAQRIGLGLGLGGRLLGVAAALLMEKSVGRRVRSRGGCAGVSLGVSEAVEMTSFLAAPHAQGKQSALNT